MNWEDIFDTTQAAESRSEYKKIPDGEYVAMVTSAMVNATKSPRVELEYTITEGDFTKRKVWQNYNLNESGVPWLKAELEKLGAPIKLAKELTWALEKINGANVKIFVKSKDVKNVATNSIQTYTNAYVNELLESSSQTLASNGLPF
jgi:hypothetical protein